MQVEYNKRSPTDRHKSVRSSASLRNNLSARSIREDDAGQQLVKEPKMGAKTVPYIYERLCSVYVIFGGDLIIRAGT